MAIDPNQGLPPGPPQAQGAPPPMVPPGNPAGPPPNPTTDPAQLTAILAAIMAQGTQEFEAQQQAALGQAVTTLLQQTPNAAGQEASSLPGQPMPPPMPPGPGDSSQDQPMGGAGGY